MRAGQRGFVLVLTLWILAAIAIAATYFAERVQASLRLATSRQDQAQALVELGSAQSEVMYRVGVTALSIHGLGMPPSVIRLDGRPYLQGKVRVELQDTAGLLNLNSAPDDLIGRVLGSLGVAEDQRAALVDALKDYIDADDLRRLQGAESAQYLQLGLNTAPRNAELTTVQELREVYGWAKQASLWGTPGILEIATVSGQPWVNLNTAPLQVLAGLAGVTPDAARAFITRRETEPIAANWVDRMLGTQFDTMLSPVVSFPGQAVRVTLHHSGLPWALRYNVQLTPTGSTSPWKIVDFHRLEAPWPSQGGDKPSAALPTVIQPAPAHASEPPKFPSRPTEPAYAPSLLAR